ncbi:MAG: ADP-ribosylglycohydrolase family protein [Gammaproteobacteria bacterium]|nr:ADP-ribosylglycohydrolase family protein [Gammaproteobacteria bacterium]
MVNRIDALHGALVADAASMGLHWMYDHKQLDKIEQTGELLFRQPDANLYAGQKAYFAHAAKRCGEYSQYGQSLRITAQLLTNLDKYDTHKHREKFFETFGPCGSYHGFADKPTKALIARMIIEGDSIPDQSGSDDDQMPALCVVPAVFSNECGEDELTAAVSVTSTNAMAIDGARVLYSCLNHISSGLPLQQALKQAADSANEELKILLLEAIGKQYDPRGVATHFGLPCHMTQGLPIAWHLLQYTTDYESVIRENVRCGGDCCGRAMAVGSIAGLVFGVPDDMKRKVRDLSLLS